MSHRLWCLAVLLPAAAVGCGQAKSQPEEQTTPEVMVSSPVKADIVNHEVFTGRTSPVERVDLRARVTGYLERVYVGRDADVETGRRVIKEGGDVKKGDVLFVIQQKPFVDALTQAEKSLDTLTTQRDFNKRNMDRMRTGGVGISASDMDSAETAYRTSESQVAAAKAALELARQNLEWATIRAPFDGRIGKRLVDRGNDVKAEDTILATIEQIDPLYAYFDVDERTTLRIRDQFPDGLVPPDAAERFPLALGLANEQPENFKHPGTLEFADNRVDPSTGTLRMWGLFENRKHDLKSGMFVRVRMGVGRPQPALFVAEGALNSDQGRKYVYVVNDENKVVYTPVTIGQRKDGRISVRGLKEADRVVVDGLQRVRSGQEVAPKEVPMPRAGDEAESVVRSP
jgi:multidrug efflux system membrane fusion protein